MNGILGPLHPSRLFRDAFREIDADVRAERTDGQALERARTRTLGALVLAGVVLTLLYYYSDQGTFARLCRHVEVLAPLYKPDYRAFWTYAWWAGLHVTGYFIVPMLVATFVFDMPLREQGLSLRGTRSKLGTYLLLLALVLPMVLAASFQDEFTNYYPFYTKANRSWFDLLVWELMYISQFFALEYFFRGFLLNTCRITMGSSAIFCMLVPYCMIHFGKPVVEALGALFAGLVLGTLALRTRSIWGGVMVHVGVAVSMDIAALLQGSGLPQRWWPF